jgi:transposase
LARSYDAGKKIKGRKRHILVDTLGLLLSVVVHPANVRHRDGAFHLLRRTRRLFPFITRILADGEYNGEKMALVAWRTGAWKLEIVKRSNAVGFNVAQAMDCRKDVRLDQSQSPFGSRFRTLRDNCHCLHPHRHDPHHAQATCCKRLVMNPNFSHGLSGAESNPFA